MVESITSSPQESETDVNVVAMPSANVTSDPESVPENPFDAAIAASETKQAEENKLKGYPKSSNLYIEMAADCLANSFNGPGYGVHVELKSYRNAYSICVETDENFYELVGLAGYLCKVIHFYRE